MKTISIVIALWMAGLAGAPAQTFTTLRAFSTTLVGTAGTDTGTNRDGVGPSANLILSDSTLYGTAANGGASGNGAVFAVNLNGSGFTNLHSFSGSVRLGAAGTNSDGSCPRSGLILSGGVLFGTAQYGGLAGSGAIFSVNTNGSNFTTIYNFSATDPLAGTNADGANPVSDLVLSGNQLYGTAYDGGASNYGTVFAINTDGSGFTNLHNFTATAGDGGYPSAGLILSGNTLYGTTGIGGGSGSGTLFAINTDGTGFTLLHGFSTLGLPAPSTNSDGGFPGGRLLLAGATLYGTVGLGGNSGSGALFAVNTNGTGFTNLYSFTALSAPVFGTNSDGSEPFGDLMLAGGILYGTASAGGTAGEGTIFAVNTNGTGFAALHEFTTATNALPYGNNDGDNPQGALTLSGNTLFGTAAGGGGAGDGALFEIVLTATGPQLAIVVNQTNVVLSWGTNFSGLVLRSTSQLGAAASWNPVLPLPGTVNGQFTVTNPVTGAQMFYRLGQ